MIEIKAPDGYNKLAENIILTVSLTVDEQNDVIAGMTGTTNQGSIAFAPVNVVENETI